MKFVGDNLIQGDLADWKMVGQKCANCGKMAYPIKRVCPECFSTDLAEFELSKHGSLHTFTVTHLGPPELKTPYILAMVDLPEGIKLMGQMDVADPLNHTLQVGAAVDIVLGKLRDDELDGEEIYAFKFKPAGCRE